jgi:hypothetical protein
MKRLALTAALVCVACVGIDAYAFLSVIWQTPTIVMQMQLGASPGPLSDGTTSWDESAEAAGASWNQHLSRVKLAVVRNSVAPIGDYNGYNNVFWSSTVFGRSFGYGVLAVTTQVSSGQSRLEADVIFNNLLQWNSYRGSFRYTSSGDPIFDLRRVALHEFGHVLGLAHPDDYGQRVSAIMNSTISNVDQLQADDIAGAQIIDAASGGSAPTTPELPGAPTGLTATSTGLAVALAWRAPVSGGTATSYSIEAGSSTSGSNLANFSTGSAATSFSTAPVPAGVYFVRVRAQNGAGAGPPSNEVVLTVGGGCVTAPAAVTSLIAATVGTTVTLNWLPAAGAATYVVEAGSSAGLTNMTVNDLDSAAVSYVAAGVARGTYYVRVRGKNSCGMGAPSNEVIVVVQ